MDQNFSLMAQSRANYYTAGSPVQFVRVELLKGDVTGEVAVCLTFKNVGTEPLTGLVVHFKCKDAAGQVLCEDDFYYEQLNAQPGAVFGSDDAVYVSDTPVSSVEVEQDRAFLNGRGVDLRNYKRVRLNMPRVLPGSISRTLQQRTGNVQLTCVPQDTEYGWFCACGAFHPKEEDTVYCSECGCDRILLQNALNTLLQPEQPAQTEPELETPLAPQPEQEEPTRIMGAAPVQPAQEEPTRIMGAPRRPQPQEPAAEPTRMLDDGMREQFPDRAARAQAEEGTRVMPAASRRAQPAAQQTEPDYEDNEEYEDERDSVAETLIRWVPPITAVICAAVALCGFVYYQFVL